LIFKDGKTIEKRMMKILTTTEPYSRVHGHDETDHLSGFVPLKILSFTQKNSKRFQQSKLQIYIIELRPHSMLAKLE
jgi:hypothetical protein